MNERQIIAAYNDGRADALAEVDDLRELVREAHGATKDLERVLREIRLVIRDGIRDAAAVMQTTANTELASWAEQVQQQADRSAAELNRAVTAARQHIINALLVAELEPTKDGKLAVRFGGNLFDDGGSNDPSAHP